MPKASPWWQWVQRHLDARAWTNADLARAIREQGGAIDESVIGRWRNRGADPSLSSVRLVATALHRDLREAIIAAGLLTEKELQAPWPSQPETDLSAVSDEELVLEVQRRLHLHAARPHPGPAPGGRRDRRAPTGNGSRAGSVQVTARSEADETVIPLGQPAGHTESPSSSNCEDEGSTTVDY